MLLALPHASVLTGIWAFTFQVSWPLLLAPALQHTSALLVHAPVAPCQP